MGMTTKQLKKVIGDDALTNPASLPVRWGRFVAMVGEAYAAFDADRDILERSMHLAADDLEAQNRQLFMTNPRPAKVEQAKAANLAKSEFLAILNDILDLSKIEANKLEIERIACDPSAIVNEAVSLMRGVAPARKTCNAKSRISAPSLKPSSDRTLLRPTSPGSENCCTI